MSSIVFVDSRVQDPQALLAGLATGVRVVTIDATRDGLAQIALALDGLSGFDSIHILSHGSAGALYLGSTVLTGANLDLYREQLAAIGSALSTDGDLLLYGCDVAAGDTGRTFIETLALLAGADVAASTDATGGAAVGGDWVLEEMVGEIDAPPPLDLSKLGDYGHTLSIAGQLDTTFDSDGIVTTAVGAGTDTLRSVLIQPDGKILVAGYSHNGSNNDFLLLRYHADGTLDTSFDGDGKATAAIGAYDDYIDGAALQADGKIVVAGYVGVGDGTTSDIGLARFNTDGSPDIGFGSSGKVTTNIVVHDGAYDVAVQPDGKILAVGSTYQGSASDWDFAVVRYNADGTPDTSFDSDGKVVTAFGGGPEAAHSVLLLADGKFLVGGYAGSSDSSYDIALARYNADGSLDTSFDGDGKAITPIGANREYVEDMALQADGKIVMVGSFENDPWWEGSDWDVAVLRYNADGSLDTSFGGDGIVTTAIGSGNDRGYAVGIQEDGKIVVAGNTFNGSNDDMAVLRYNADGSLDGSFADSGILQLAVGSGSDLAVDLAIQADGNIVVAGGSHNGSNEDAAVVRVLGGLGGTGSGGGSLPAGSLDASFDVDGKVLTAVTGGYDTGIGVALQTDGKVLIVGYAPVSGGYDLSVLRYNADGSLDASFDGDGKVSTSISGGDDVAHDVAVQADGKIVVAGWGKEFGVDHTVLVRYNANGTLDTGFGGGDGKLTTVIGSAFDSARSVALQADGKIVAAGQTYDGSTWDIYVARYNADGSLDTNFDGDGVVVTAVGAGHDQQSGLALQADGKILVSGDSWNGSNYDFSLVRYNTDGSLDTGFGGGDGKVTTGFGAGHDLGKQLTLQADGKILVAGTSHNGTDFDFALARYNSDGTLDTSFGGGDGKLTTALGGGDDNGYDVEVQADGKIVVSGWAWNGANQDFALARYAADGSLDASFSDDGLLLVPIGSGDDYGVELALQSDGNIILGGYGQGGGTSMDVALIRVLGAADTPAGPAEISVVGYGTGIADGDSAPGTADGTDFGVVLQGAAPVDRIFTVRNDGGEALVLGSVTLPAGFSILEGLSANLAPGAADTFAIRLDTASIGTKSGDVSFSTSDSDENPYNFSISGVVAALAPEATVSGYGVDIADGDGVPGEPDGTDFGTAVQGGAAVDRVFTVENDGSATLTLGGVTLPAGFSLVEGLSASLEPGQSDTFTVRLDTAISGVKSGEVSFSSNDSDENPYNFSIQGSVTDPAALQAFARAVLLQPDNRIVVAGSAWNGADYDFLIARYDAYGSPDAGFGVAGVATTSITGNEQGFGVALQGDGKLVVSGTAITGEIWGGNPGTQFALVRYNPDGSLDTSFDLDGKVTTRFAAEFGAIAFAVAAQADGKILAAGVVDYDLGPSSDLGLIRYNADGSLDSGFGSGGKVITSFSGGEDWIFSISVLTDGKILAAGSSNGPNNDMALARYNANGSLDTMFGGGDGTVTTAIGGYREQINDMAVQADGKIIAVGGSESGPYWANLSDWNIAVARYNVDGSLDTGFGVGGIVTTRIGYLNQSATAVAIQPDGRILVGVNASNQGYGTPAVPDAFLVRYLADGTLDTIFGEGGAYQVSFGGGEEHISDLVLRPDGSIVAVGGRTVNGNYDSLGIVIIGTEGNDDLVGDLGDDTILGLGGHDTLDGAAGADLMEGGSGGDIYYVDDAGDQVVETSNALPGGLALPGGGGGGFKPGLLHGLFDSITDTVIASINYSLENLQYVENLRLADGTGTDGTGNALANTLEGNELHNLLLSLGGNDTVEGLAGSDTLDGGSGIDSLAGGDGDDVYYAGLTGTAGAQRIVFVSDTVVEAAEGGADTVFSNASAVLAAGVENLVLSGPAFWRPYTGTGNDLDNQITGNGAARHRLFGEGGNDTLDGGGGRDVLDGGAGDDVLIYDASDNSINGGTDSDTLKVDGSGVTLDLTAIADTVIQDVEVIDLTGTGANTLTLAVADVLAISSTTDTLRIDGDAGDVVSGSGWSDQGTGVNPGYHTYTQPGTALATLLVDTDITLNIS